MSSRTLGSATAINTVLALAPVLAFAQTPPDAGQVLQQRAPALEEPKPSPRISIELPSGKPAAVGGAVVKLVSVTFKGNTLFADDALAKVVGDVSGRSFDLAGLRALADRVTAHYRQAGYPFARCLVPQQKMSDGVLQLEVVEGRYGRIRTSGPTDLTAAAEPFLSRLKPGAAIERQRLERVTLLLNDQPGIAVVPTLEPGAEVGTGDLNVTLERTALVEGQIGVDNQGNHYTGKTQARADLDINSPLRLGDQLSLKSLLTEGKTWFGSVGYGLPIGNDGLRGQLSYAKTAYQLGSEFARLGAMGSAVIQTAALSYPLVRTHDTEVQANATLQRKDLNDQQQATATSADKSSVSSTYSVRFNHRDDVLGAGVTFGSVSLTTGHLRLDAAQQAQDDASARTKGHFEKLNADLARTQALSGPWSLYGRAAGQWATKNLDSSEKFGLGGANGVRAYPVGEGFGDKGWLGQVEIRYAHGEFAPYAFYDAGMVHTSVKPWTAGDNERKLAGAGVGVRHRSSQWRWEASIAWKTQGGAAQSDSSGHRPNVWVSAYRSF